MATPVSDRAGIRQVIRALVKDGWVLYLVDDGGDEIKVFTELDAVNAITAVGDATLWVAKNTRKGWVRFVMGNDPEEVAADWTINLSETLDPLTNGWCS